MVSTQQLPKVRDVDLAFGSTVWLPVPEVIPKEFWHENQYSRFMDGWFFDGLTEKSLKNIILSDSLSSEEAGERVKQIMAILESWAPKHEHKIAGCAFLLSQFCTLKN